MASLTAANGAPLKIYIGRLGAAICYEDFIACMGGKLSLVGRYLSSMTVKELPQPGRPKTFARKKLPAYRMMRMGDGLMYMIIPPTRCEALRRLKLRTEVVADTIHPENAPLPAPRSLSPNQWPCPELTMALPPYTYQETILDYLFNGPAAPLGDTAVKNFTARTMLQLDTGLGKTYIGCAAVGAVNEPALVVVPTDAIRMQWLEAFAENLPALKCAPYNNSARVPPGPGTHDVVVIIINTARDKTPAFFEGYGLIILDESHEYHSAKNGNILWLAQTKRVLALSATPNERIDGLDKIVNAHITPPLLPDKIPGFSRENVRFRGTVKQVRYKGHPDHCAVEVSTTGSVSAIGTIGNIIRDPCRLRLVAAEVARLYHMHEQPDAAELGLGPRPPEAATPDYPAGEIRRHCIYVFAEHRDFLPAIRDALLECLNEKDIFTPEIDVLDSDGVAAPLRGPEGEVLAEVPKDNARGVVHTTTILRGGATHDDLVRARSSYVVPATYGYCRRGISLKDITAAVYATPRHFGGWQITGRNLRAGSDTSIVRQFVDIIDVRTPLKKQAPDRKKVFEERGFDVYTVDVDYQEYA